ncbi:MAG TPA: histidine kinase [Solirubrobacter sp.]|nr:histidine kinase [Solirubrobacter sp.]
MGTPRWQMLPGSLLQAPGAKRTARDWIVDVTMFALAILIGFIALGDTEDQHSELGLLIDLVLGALSCLALWFRRRHPVGVAAFTSVCGFVSAMSAGGGLFALFNLALRGTRRQIVLFSVIALAIAATFPLIYPSDDLGYVLEVILGVLIIIVVLGWGLFTRTQRDLLQSSHERARQLEAEQRARVEQAREAERRRIAGEMHDVLAHRLSLLSVHAGALEFNPDAPPEEIAEAAAVIRSTAHEALSDLRDVIGVLREGDGGVGPPQPTLDAIPALIEESRAAGMKVDARIEASNGDALIGRTAYRVVQEGLTNARKHAPAAAVQVTVAGEQPLVVEVVSRRPAVRSSVPGAGTGLIGLAERVALAGGTLEHGPNERGDFVLRATL